MAASFNPYYGEPKIQALQKARDEQVPELLDLPGAVVHARTFSSDDPAALGWDDLRRIMYDEGLVTLRGADAATIETAKTKLGSFDPKLHFWDLFLADAETIWDVCGKGPRNPSLPCGSGRLPVLDGCPARQALSGTVDCLARRK